jgi:lysine N6-hydroxylase
VNDRPPAPQGRLDGDHDVLGVGIGPFNLGLAALADPLELRCAFFEQRPAFSWHPGLLLDGTTLQVPFLADLVTMADPTSPFSFLNYLHHEDRLFRFYFHQEFLVPRREFDRYCRWVAEQLPSCRFGWRVTDVCPAGDGGWLVDVTDGEHHERHRARHVVFGVGSRPSVPACAQPHLGPQVLHSASYLERRDALSAAEVVVVVGSGQSAAEVVLDLLQRRPHGGVEWYTRSRGFLPMEYSKLGLEYFTPDYAAWFHTLDETTRDELRAGQDLLYKGISGSTSAAIYDLLYERTIDRDEPGLVYAAGCALQGVEVASDGRLRLDLAQRDDGRTFTRHADALVLGTGYEQAPLPVDLGAAALALDQRGRPVVDLERRLVDRDGAPTTLYVQNAELHSHGVGAPDLGLGAHRNAVILNTITDREVYRVRARNIFQTFGVPS